jgi:hypothetical protein
MAAKSLGVYTNVFMATLPGIPVSLASMLLPSGGLLKM